VLQDFFAQTLRRLSGGSSAPLFSVAETGEKDKGNTAQLRLRASTDLFRQFCGLESLKYIQYSCAFQTLP
jgi:hypothetical protein